MSIARKQDQPILGRSCFHIFRKTGNEANEISICIGDDIKVRKYICFVCSFVDPRAGQGQITCKRRAQATRPTARGRQLRIRRRTARVGADSARDVEDAVPYEALSKIVRRAGCLLPPLPCLEMRRPTGGRPTMGAGEEAPLIHR